MLRVSGRLIFPEDTVSSPLPHGSQILHPKEHRIQYPVAVCADNKTVGSIQIGILPNSV